MEAWRKKGPHFCRSEADASCEKTQDLTQNNNSTHVHSNILLVEAVSTLTNEQGDECNSAGFSVCELETAEPHTAIPQNTEEKLKPFELTERISASHCSTPAALHPSQVRPSDFTRISDWPSKTPCAVCGRKPTLYKNKSKNFEKPGCEPVMICEGCYNRAVSRHVASIVTLPGTIDPQNMKPTGSFTGRCSVCNTLPAAWYDKAAQLGMGESCYSREVSRVSQEE